MFGGMEEVPKVGDPPLAELVGLHFGLPSNEDTLAMSVFEKNQNIIGQKTLCDSRLGVYFLTGDGIRCSSCDAFTKDSCDGHFGHIVLPMPVYHPFHVAFTQQILSKICIICYRLTLKKKSTLRASGMTVGVKGGAPFTRGTCSDCKVCHSHKDAELPHKANKHGAELTKTCKVIKIRKKLKTEVLVRKLQPFKGYNRQAATELAMKVQAANAVDRSSCGSLNSSRFKARPAGKLVSAKLTEDGFSLKTRIVSTALDSCATMKSSEAIEDGCMYCGALKILRCIPHKVIEKLGMHNFVARPEAWILMCLPVPPSCTRVKPQDTPSVDTKVLMDNQYRLLQAVVKKGWDTLGQLLEALNSMQQKLGNLNDLT